ncbi:MAG: restriction endonuclease subunit S [Syntrophobacteraceae bacterium]
MRWKAYPGYKKSRWSWLECLPESWGTKRIKHTTYVKGRIGWQGLRSDEFIDDGPLLVTGTDFRDGKINWESCYHVTEQRYAEDSFIQLREGDLLVTKDGTIGKLAVVTGLPGPATLNSGIFLTRQITGHCLERFLFWVLSSEVFTAFIHFTKAGATISHLYQNVFVEFTYPVPLISEQLTIAAFLDRETERIDSLIAKKQRQIELLNEKRAALISRTVTKGLNPDVRMKDSGVEWLGEIPEHWKITRLKFCIKTWTSISYGIVQPGDHVEDGIPFIQTTNITGDKLQIVDLQRTTAEIEAAYPRSRLNQGDVILGIRASIGAAHVVPKELERANLSRGVARIVPSHLITAEFLTLYLRSSSALGYWDFSSQGSTFSEVSIANVKELAVPVPPAEEQNEIATHISSKISVLDRVKSKVFQSIARLQEYRTTLITAAVTGKIDVRQEATHARTAH